MLLAKTQPSLTAHLIFFGLPIWAGTGLHAAVLFPAPAVHDADTANPAASLAQLTMPI